MHSLCYASRYMLYLTYNKIHISRNNETTNNFGRRECLFVIFHSLSHVTMFCELWYPIQVWNDLRCHVSKICPNKCTPGPGVSVNDRHTYGLCESWTQQHRACMMIQLRIPERGGYTWSSWSIMHASAADQLAPPAAAARDSSLSSIPMGHRVALGG